MAMNHWCLRLASIACCLPWPATAIAERPTPTRYEIMLNGESFNVELNQIQQLTSRDDPKKSYQVAIRVAEYQPWRLNTFAIDYHRGFQVEEDDQGETLRRVVFRHALGFELTVHDLGGPIDRERRAGALKLLVDATQALLQEQAQKQVRVTPPKQLKLGPFEATRVGLSCQQANQQQRALVFFFAGPTSSGSCVLRYPAAAQADVLAIVQPMLQSLQPVAVER